MALPLRIRQRTVERRSNINMEQRPVQALHNRNPARSHPSDIALSRPIRLGQLELLVQRPSIAGLRTLMRRLDVVV